MELMSIVLCALVMASDVTAMYSTRELEGYSVGYFSDCPGSEKMAIIQNKTLKYLRLFVQSPGNLVTLKTRGYTYYQMKALAKDRDLDFRKKTMLFVGGYFDSPTYDILANVIGVPYKKLGYNVLLLDTSRFTTMEYPVAARLIRPVGKHAAEMLAELTNLGLDPKKLEIIGLSLGGQTASFIAKNYQLLTGIKVARLTGLDPAGPCFRHLGPKERIDESDADFVDIVNTNVDGFGMAAPVGHVNIYVNGGEYQAGELYWFYCTVFCSHGRVFEMWMAALFNPKKFIAIQCDSVQEAKDRGCYGKEPQVTNVLGVHTDPKKPGIFYLSATQTYPYYLAEKGLKEENDFYLSAMKMVNKASVMTF